jgi:predicted glycosyltransferase involved in capsule biosynthesis
MRVFTYADQREMMGPDSDLFPHQAAACRNFGFDFAREHTAHDLIITIDGDCPLPSDFMASYA